VEIKRWISSFENEDESLFKMFNTYVNFQKTREASINKFNQMSTKFHYYLDANFDYEFQTVTLTLNKEEND